MKRTKKLLALLIALVLCVGGYAAVQQLNETTAVTEEEGSFALTSHGVDDLLSMVWTVGETTFSFTKTGEDWQVTTDTAYPVAQAEVAALAEELIAITASRKLDNVTALADYGLETPAFTLAASWSDGTQTTYSLGAETPFGDGWYMSLGESGVIYVATDDLSDTFDVTMASLTQMETIPNVEDVTRVVIGTALDASKAEVSATIDPDALWTSGGIPLDAEAMDTLLADIQAITWSELVTAQAGDLSVYGLDDVSATAITLHSAGTSATILIGANDDAGDYYARLTESTMVYTVAADSVSSILASSVDTLWSKAILPLTTENMASATFIVGDKTYIHDAETSAELWSDVSALTAVSCLTDAPVGMILLTVDVTDTAGKTASLVIREYSATEYAADIDGRYVLVSADAVDPIIRQVKYLAQ